MDELMLKVEHISKEYRLGTIGGGTLKAELQSKFAKLRHKEDPNLKIGEKAHEKNERFLALDDVNFEIKKGERIGIIGHNGAGKSTVLKLICRVTAPSKGNIYLNGRITSMLEVGTGFHGELTGRENIYLNGAILGMSKAEVDKKFDEIVEFSEIGQFIDTPIKRYSSGMKVKLGFAVASHLDSEIMIMDEVLAVGDMAFQNKCIEQMKKVADDEGRTILYVSHNMHTIRQLCNRCIVLEHGKLVFDGDVEQAINIYLDNHSNDSIYIDYTNIPRLGFLPEISPIVTQSTEFIGKENNVFKKGQTVNFKIRLRCYETINNVSFRLEILDESRCAVTTSMLENVFNFENIGESDINIIFNPELLSDGKYNMNYTFYIVDEFGHNKDIDCVHGLSFVYKAFDKMKWNSKNWGNIVYPQSLIEVKQIEN